MTALHRLAGTQLPVSLSPITGDPCCPLPERGCEESSGTFSRPTRHVYVEGDKVWAIAASRHRATHQRPNPVPRFRRFAWVSAIAASLGLWVAIFCIGYFGVQLIRGWLS